MAGSIKELIDCRSLPHHIAIIMDGNGRWARRRGLPRIAGHRAGMEALRRAIEAATGLGIKILTFYAFSTENWKRPLPEIEFLMQLPQQYLHKDLDDLHRQGIRVRLLGDPSKLPQHTQQAIAAAVKKTAGNERMIVNFALNYGGRHELISAIQTIVGKAKSGALDVEEIDEELVSRHLFTAGLPDPDLLIRPSGELRLSNFLLWQLAYAELWFADIYWPDFQEEHLYRAIYDYQQRERRFGGINT